MLEQIVTIEIPTEKVIDRMVIKEINYWLNVLHPFYIERAAILNTYGIDAYLKCLKWLWFYQMKENLTHNKPRWERISDYS